MHLFLIFAGKIPRRFLRLIRDTADICEASPAFRVIVFAVASPFLLLMQYLFQNGRSTYVFPDIPDYVLFRVSKTVTNEFLFHGILYASLFQYRRYLLIPVIAYVPVKLFTVLIKKNLSRYYVDAEPLCGIMVFPDIDKEDFKLAFVIRPELIHYRFHLLAGDTTY